MEKAYKIITKFLSSVIVVVFSILVISCVLQVFTRFVLNSSLSWTEELARYTFIWANMLGAILCTKNKSNATVSVVTDNLSVEKQVVLNKIVDVLSIIIGLILLFYGSKVAWAVRTQLSPALRISMSFVYGAAPVFGALLIFYCIYDIYSLRNEVLTK
ncbi:MAG: TRAP transporter small permease [Peptoniphilus lacydonensis]|uniref:TRAP transporter small permease n=1 Tax=Peptoniphilus lacydonensis TaxID=1673725 RepID=UPI002904146D|nr:TRAP transporter small permease [Peptoniphilus lacydonensis]MDU1954850.1 TRAP transporter small permease [Peptoniphilus lacydonensis]MDU2114779.1 TRAP transporter small permease [Peptoniphilus lacydonensis]MDU5274343.1 TRAP transporter small permease [Peptoniphilus lacydonensis]